MNAPYTASAPTEPLHAIMRSFEFCGAATPALALLPRNRAFPPSYLNGAAPRARSSAAKSGTPRGSRKF